MPDLSDLLKDSVGDVPEFHTASLVARGRHHRRLQVAGVASIVVLIASALAAWSNRSDDGVVVATRSSTDTSATTDSTSSSSTTVGSTGGTTVTAGTPTTSGYSAPPTAPSGEVSTTVPDARAPAAGDFGGTLTVSATTVQLPYGVDVDLWIRNTSGYAIEPSLGTMPTSVATICGRFTADGQPVAALESDVNAWFMTAPQLQPGETAGRSNHYDPTPDDVGSVICEGAIVASTDEWRTMKFVARITAIPAVTISVVAEPSTTTLP
jgi:hypothetical protein